MKELLTAVIIIIFHISMKKFIEHKLMNDIIIYKLSFNIIIQIKTVINDHTSL